MCVDLELKFRAEYMQEIDQGGWAHRVAQILSRGVPDLAAHFEIGELLVEVNAAMLSAPSSVLTSYDTIKESDLLKWQYLWDVRLINGDSIPIPLDDPYQCALGLGSLIRALDKLYLDFRPHVGPPDGPDDWRVGDFFIVPRNQSVPWSAHKRNQSFKNRGLIHNRIIPVTIDDLTVRLIILDTIEDDVRRPRKRFGAAVFKDFDVDLAHNSDDRFHAASVNSVQHAIDIERQLEASSKEDCFIVVWPELTMPDSHRKKVSRILKDNILMEHPRVYPDIIVAGSWHETENGSRYNVSHILNRFGRTVAKYRKTVAYSDGEHGIEDIKLGSEFPLIVTNSIVAAFGICKDFCTASRSSPYHQVKADFVVVPSMGRISTMHEHKTAASNLRNTTGSRVFIVQQHLPRNEGAAAFVLPPSRAKDEDAVIMENGKIWVSFPWD